MKISFISHRKFSCMSKTTTQLGAYSWKLDEICEKQKTKNTDLEILMYILLKMGI